MINDQDVAIGTGDLDVVRLHTGFNGDISRLAHWPQHIYLWGSGSVPEFDLLLIDIKFEQDTYDPFYFGETEDQESVTVNPFGLLHALPLVARQDLTNMPFIWGIHSGEPSAVKDDPVAIWAYGLLCAMEQREGWDGYKEDLDHIPQYFSNRIAGLQALPAEAAWQEMLGRYRSKLKAACEKGRLQIEPDELNGLIREVESADSEFTDLEGEILFHAGYDGETILLRSLFADVTSWNASAKSQIIPFLKDLKSAQEQANIFPRVNSIVTELIEHPSQKTLSDIIDREFEENKSRKALIAVGVIVCVWLRRYFFDYDRKLKQVLEDLGYFYQVQPTRYLKYAGFNLTPQRFLNTLPRESLSPVLRECGRRYWEEVLVANGHSKNPVPACLLEASRET